MTNASKINGKQKEIMADFMVAHPQLARNILPNCAQGRSVMNKLWDQLTNKLNMAGPPIKDIKSWRKAFTDQKHQAKKKLSFNMNSKKKTGGGPFEEITLTSAEEQIVQAAGIGAAVEGLSSVKTFGSCKEINKLNIEEIEELLLSDNSESENVEKVALNIDKNIETGFESAEKETSKVNRRSTRSESKLNLLKSNLEKFEESQVSLNNKFDRLLKLMEISNELKEKSINMKEKEHLANIEIKKIDLEIKTIELEMLKQRI